MVESFENSKRALSVAREGSGLRSDFILKPELREFQAELYRGTQPVVHVRINVKLVRMPSREIIATETFDTEVTATGNDIDTVVLTFDDALGKVLKRIVTWTIQQVHREERAGRVGRR
jgi:cholesterol transport system auxiliary component